MQTKISAAQFNILLEHLRKATLPTQAPSTKQVVSFMANPCPYIPISVAKEIVDSVGRRKKKDSYLVLFTIELAGELYARGAMNVVVATTEFCSHTKKLTELIGYKYMLLQEIEDNEMKFTVVISNPPYKGKSELHQQFFNKAVDLVEDGGVVSFIQPATPYFIKKGSIKTHASAMLENVRKYQSDVKIFSGSIFESAFIGTSLALTTLTKVPSSTQTLRRYLSENRNEYKNVDIESINMLGMEPSIYDALVKKVLPKAEELGSIQDLVTADTTQEKLHLQKIRGNIGKDDFYSFISNNKDYWKIDSSLEYGLTCNDYDSLISYLTSYFARFCLSIYKFGFHSDNGELKSVPLVPLDRIWNDKLLCEYFDITDAEYIEILRCLPDYHGLGNNLS
jgi:hypothetical protein